MGFSANFAIVGGGGPFWSHQIISESKPARKTPRTDAVGSRTDAAAARDRILSCGVLTGQAPHEPAMSAKLSPPSQSSVQEQTLASLFRPAVPPYVLSHLLTGYDADLSHYLVSGFTDGFKLGCEGFLPGPVHSNLPSCELAPHVIDDYIANELRACRVSGPFLPSDHAVNRISPIGLTRA